MRSQTAAAILSLACFLAGAAIALTASAGTAGGHWNYATGLEILLPGFALGVAALASGGLWLARALRLNDSTGWKFGAVGFAGALILVFLPLNELRLYLVSPPIHDVSTDPEYPPQFDALLSLRKGAQNGPDYDGAKTIVYDGKPTPISVVQRKAYPDIKPYYALLAGKDAQPADILFWRAFERAKDAGFKIIAYNQRDGTIEATHTRFWFGQVQDVSIRVRPAGKIGARVDIRVKSRNGENDAGVSAQMVRDYLKSLH